MLRFGDWKSIYVYQNGTTRKKTGSSGAKELFVPVNEKEFRGSQGKYINIQGLSQGLNIHLHQIA
jgi:hypothetical protein